MERLPRHFVRRERYTRVRKNYEIETVKNEPGDVTKVSKMSYRNTELCSSGESSKDNYRKGWTLTKRVSGSFRKERRNSKEEIGDKKMKRNSKTNLLTNNRKEQQRYKPNQQQLTMKSEMESKFRVDCNEESNTKWKTFRANLDKHFDEDLSQEDNKSIENQIQVEVITNKELQVVSKSGGSLSIQQRTEKVTYGIDEDVEESFSLSNEGGNNMKRALKKPRKWCGTVRNRKHSSNRNIQALNELDYYKNVQDLQDFKESEDFQSGDDSNAKIIKYTKETQLKLPGQEVKIQAKSFNKDTFESNLIGSYSDTLLCLNPKSNNIIDSIQNSIDLSKFGSPHLNISHALKSPHYLVDSLQSFHINNKNENAYPLVFKEIVNRRNSEGNRTLYQSDCEFSVFKRSMKSGGQKSSENANIRHTRKQHSSLRAQGQTTPPEIEVKFFKNDFSSAINSPMKKNYFSQKYVKPQILPETKSPKTWTEPSTKAPKTNASHQTFSPISFEDMLSNVLNKFHNHLIKQLAVLFLCSCYVLQKHGSRFLYYIILPLFYFGIFFLAYCSCRTVCEKNSHNALQEILI